MVVVVVVEVVVVVSYGVVGSSSCSIDLHDSEGYYDLFSSILAFYHCLLPLSYVNTLLLLLLLLLPLLNCSLFLSGLHCLP